MKLVNWEVFFGSSSTVEAICLFAFRKYSFKEFSINCWPKECKAAIKILKQRGYAKAIRSARTALLKRGYSDYRNAYCDC